jgi:two-component system LytT family sensor kinase
MSFKRKVLNQIVQNLVFWTISFVITLNLFSRGDEIRKIDWIYTFLFHIPFVVVVSLNMYQTIPNILKKYNIWYYLFLMTFAGFGIVQSVYSLSYGPIAEFLFPEYYFVGVYNPLELFGIMVIYVTTSTLIELSKSWFNRKEKEVEIAQLEEEKTKSELKALQAQINPHFLFNSLNTIYGEALKKTDKAPEMILKLSDILRYVVENMNKNEVQLDQEIEYIGKFIDLQKERLSNPNRVIFVVNGNVEDLKIQPLLLITFIENAFKYGSVSGLNERIKISLAVEDKTLEMIVENALNEIEVIGKSESSGTGLANTQKRLEFSYPGKHNLDIKKDDCIFKAVLKIDLS